jgi:hypothetical protein
MNPARKDWLSVCNDQKVPLDDFKAMFCDRCMQPECTRSKVGQSSFEQRVARWYDDYYANVPRLDPSDPRYGKIAAQGFIAIDAGPTPEIRSSWLDPRDLTEKGPSSVSTPPVTASAPPVPVEVEPRIIAPSALIRPVMTAPVNTPNRGPRMLGGAPPPKAAPAPDPWGAPNPSPAQPADSKDTVVTAGATVKLGGSGSGV